MKKLILFLLLSLPLYAQNIMEIRVAGDTTTLKTMDGLRPVLLLQYGGSTFDRTGGGIFQAIDSTYAEGSYAFDHAWTGMQWARIGLIDPSPTVNTITVSGAATITGTATIGNLLATTIDTAGVKFQLHNVQVGDSALGKVFLDAADTTLKAGTGSDLVTITDLAP